MHKQTKNWQQALSITKVLKRLLEQAHSQNVLLFAVEVSSLQAEEKPHHQPQPEKPYRYIYLIMTRLVTENSPPQVQRSTILLDVNV